MSKGLTAQGRNGTKAFDLCMSLRLNIGLPGRDKQLLKLEQNRNKVNFF